MVDSVRFRFRISNGWKFVAPACPFAQPAHQRFRISASSPFTQGRRKANCCQYSLRHLSLGDVFAFSRFTLHNSFKAIIVSVYGYRARFTPGPGVKLCKNTVMPSIYCIFGSGKINTQRPRDARARVSVNFRNFSPCMAPARRARARV